MHDASAVYTMAKRLVIPVCSYIDGLMSVIRSQAGHEVFNAEFRQLQTLNYNNEPSLCASTLSDEERSVLQNAEVVLADPLVLARNLGLLKKAKWVHSTFAGVEPIVSQCTTAPDFVLTRQVGRTFGQQMGEYVLVQIMARERELFLVQSDMQQKIWQSKSCGPRTLPSLSVGILGVGSIGSRIAQMCKAMEMTVWGLTRTSQDVPFVDHNCHRSELPLLLESCDYVCNTLPSTPQTRGLLNGDVLKHCAAQKSVFINMGRGDIVSGETIVQAIDKGWLGGAILDVFETEPLPKHSALWDTPGVCLTPHMSGLCTASETASVFLSNLKRYLSGQPLQYVVDFSRGY